MRSMLTVLLLLACVSEARAERNAKPAIERDVVEVAAPPGILITSVHIDNRLGDVKVQGHDTQSIRIQSYKRAGDPETLERLVVSLVPDAQGRVRISTALRESVEYRPVQADSVAIDLVVFVPRSAAIDAQLWKGNLEISKVDNGATLVVDRGRIDVKQVSGQVVSNLRTGEQVFAEIFGALETRTIEGNLRLQAIQGDRLYASMVRGRIEGKTLNVKEMRVQSIFGDIELMAEFMAGGSYKVSSRRGKVSLRFHGQTPVNVHVTALQPMLGSDLDAEQVEEGQWRGQFGTDASVRPAQLEVRSGTGAVVVRHF